MLGVSRGFSITERNTEDAHAQKPIRNTGYFTDSFSNWVLPEFFVWVLIGSGAAVWFAQEGHVFAMGLNALINMQT